MTVDIEILTKYQQTGCTPRQVGFNPRIQGWFNVHNSVSMIHQINRIKDKDHVIISEQKALDEIWQSFMIKTPLDKQGTRKNFLNLVTGCENPRAHTTLW